TCPDYDPERNNMKTSYLYFRVYLAALLMLADVPAEAADVKELFAIDLADYAGKEGRMIEVSYPPGVRDMVDRQDAHAFLYVRGGMKNASPTRGSASAQPVERGRIVVSQLAAHLRRQVPHLPLDRVSRIGPDAVGVGIVRRPEQVAVAEERNERHRHVVFLERCIDLPLEQVARLRDEGAAALVGPELLRLPDPPVAVVELLDEPGEPSGAGLRHHHAQSRMTLEDAPGEEVDEGLEEVREEELGVLEDARCLAGDAI